MQVEEGDWFDMYIKFYVEYNLKNGENFLFAASQNM